VKSILYPLQSKRIIKIRSGEYFASAGEDKEVKIWDYDQGRCIWVGYGHSNTINRVN
jgi:WD40 repeat protein